MSIYSVHFGLKWVPRYFRVPEGPNLSRTCPEGSKGTADMEADAPKHSRMGMAFWGLDNSMWPLRFLTVLGVLVGEGQGGSMPEALCEN